MSVIRFARLANTLNIAHAYKVKCLTDDLVVTCHKIVDTSETASINLIIKQIIGFYVLLVITVKYYMKHGLTIIPCLLSY